MRSAARSWDVRDRVGERRAELGVVLQQPHHREQLVVEAVRVGAHRAHRRDHREVVERDREVARDHPATLDGRDDHLLRVGAQRAEHLARQAGSRLGVDRRVGRRPAQGRLGAEHGGGREELLAHRGRIGERAGRGERLLQLGQRLRRRTAQRHQDAPPWPAAASEDSRVSRSARNRSTTRALRSSSCRLSPTIRSASEVARVPTSARRVVSAALRSASICACALLEDPLLLGLPLLAHLGDDRGPLLARLLTDAGGLVPGLGDLRGELVLGGVRFGLRLVQLRELLPDGVLASGHRAVDRRDDVAGQEPQQQGEGSELDEERRVRHEEVALERDELAGYACHESDPLRSGMPSRVVQAPRTKTNSAMNARLMKNIASTRPTVRKKMVWRRPCASG